MKLRAAELHERRWQLAAPLRTARGVVRERRGLVLRVISENGTIGLGEASPATWVGGESVEACGRALAEVVRSVRRGADSTDLESMLAAGTLPASAACALDCALLDVEARERGGSVADSLRRGAPHRARVSVAALLLEGEPSALAREAAEAAARGFLCCKVKVGGRPVGDDLERIAAIRSALPPDVGLRADANQAWTETEATRFFAALPPRALEYVEEPLADAALLGALRRSRGTKIALDESVDSLAQLEERAHTADVLVVKAQRLGGLRPALRLADRALALGLEVVVTDSLEGPVGMSAALHLAVVLPARAVGLGGARLLEAVPPFLQGPEASVRGPGLGVSPQDAELCRA